MRGIEAIWQRIEAWYAAHEATHLLRPPATEKAIRHLEESIHLGLPEDMKASLLIHDGILYSPEQEVLSLKRIHEEWSIWNESVSAGQLPYSLEECSARGWNVEHWVPITWDFGSDGFYTDLKPGSDSFGHVFFLNHEEGPQFKIGNPTELVFESYTSFLKHISNQLESPDFDVNQAILFNEQGRPE